MEPHTPSSSEPKDVTWQGWASRLATRVPLVGGAVLLILCIGLGALIVLRENGGPFGFDVNWMATIVANRTPAGEWLAFLMNRLGGGLIGIVIVPLGTVALMLLRRRPLAALYAVTAAVASSLSVQLLKHLFGRARPEDILVHVDFGSFPSGHVANAATLAVTLGVLFPQIWVWLSCACYTVLMMLSRTYLGAHWVSDTIGGSLLGAGVALIVWQIFARRLAFERERTLRKRKIAPDSPRQP
ncbi:phosphatase PAP2 family protein [Luethyella okanaganae]|uniref:Phosphatase PAP2 family protein n=1 Tax=Luethyella okanaganae TaxID=69372 RepID=A0ABW1VCP9_9MICO